MPSPTSERILVDFFYAPPVGHVIEALHHCLALYRADPRRSISLLLNAAAPTELGELFPFVRETYAIEAPFVEPAPEAERSLRGVPREWDRVVDDPAAPPSDSARAVPQGCAITTRPPTATSQPPETGRARPRATDAGTARTPPAAPARARPGGRGSAPEGRGRSDGGAHADRIEPTLALPLGRILGTILDALVAALPELRVLLVGRSARDARTSSSQTAPERRRLLSHAVAPIDFFDVPLFEQLAAVETADVFLAPHTGFGMAALAVGTPWLALSGGRWFEWYFNRVLFRSMHFRHRALPVLLAVRRGRARARRR